MTCQQFRQSSALCRFFGQTPTVGAATEPRSQAFQPRHAPCSRSICNIVLMASEVENITAGTTDTPDVVSPAERARAVTVVKGCVSCHDDAWIGVETGIKGTLLRQ